MSDSSEDQAMTDSQLKSLSPEKDWTRRNFVMSVLASGFALATQPVSAQTITTDTHGLTAGEVKVPVKDGEIPAYRALPASGAPHPVVLVVQEIFGVHEHIKDICRRLAKVGYFAIAPELYARQGGVSHLKDIQEILTNVVSKVPDAQVMGDLDATLAWAGASGQADPARAAITGFCWGGRIVWLYCAHNPGVKAGAAWYGRLVGQGSELTPRHPVDIARSLEVPVLGLYGGADQGIPIPTIEQMRAALERGSSGSQIVVYEDAPHGFNADYRPSYRKDAATDGWKRMLAWFKSHGVG
jgi:carboxymethylenebutenolidase